MYLSPFRRKRETHIHIHRPGYPFFVSLRTPAYSEIYDEKEKERKYKKKKAEEEAKNGFSHPQFRNPSHAPQTRLITFQPSKRGGLDRETLMKKRGGECVARRAMHIQIHYLHFAVQSKFCRALV